MEPFHSDDTINLCLDFDHVHFFNKETQERIIVANPVTEQLLASEESESDYEKISELETGDSLLASDNHSTGLTSSNHREEGQ